MDLKEGIVLVTGGSSGIGLETARELVSRGARVAICGRDAKKLASAAESSGALAIRADVADEADVKRMVAQVIETYGDYNVLVNNAGYGHFAPLLETTLESMRRQYDTNVFGAMMVARESARHFAGRGGGSIVNVASTAAQRGFAGGTAYASSKFALRGMTECWRAELRKHEIRVMEINPSEVITEFFATAGRSREASEKKLHAVDIAKAIASMLEMHDRGFVTEMSVWATNPE
jgi:3-oxoacyl-[acyl-carrier protein] reductase